MPRRKVGPVFNLGTMSRYRWTWTRSSGPCDPALRTRKWLKLIGYSSMALKSAGLTSASSLCARLVLPSRAGAPSGRVAMLEVFLVVLALFSKEFSASLTLADGFGERDGRLGDWGVSCDASPAPMTRSLVAIPEAAETPRARAGRSSWGRSMRLNGRIKPKVCPV